LGEPCNSHPVCSKVAENFLRWGRKKLVTGIFGRGGGAVAKVVKLRLPE